MEGYLVGFLIGLRLSCCADMHVSYTDIWSKKIRL